MSSKKRKTLRNTVPCQVTVSCQEHCSLTEESRRILVLRLSSNNSMHFITVIKLYSQISGRLFSLLTNLVETFHHIIFSGSKILM